MHWVEKTEEIPRVAGSLEQHILLVDRAILVLTLRILYLFVIPGSQGELLEPVTPAPMVGLVTEVQVEQDLVIVVAEEDHLWL